MYEKQIEKIPGFEKTPDLKIVKDVQIICEMAKIKLQVMEDNFFNNGEALKKLLDDRRELAQLCLAMFRILFLPHQENKEIYESTCLSLFRKVTGKSIDELLKDD